MRSAAWHVDGHPWFAWHPVRDPYGAWLWCRRVWRYRGAGFWLHRVD